jgi:cell division septal protein FtsQ
MSLRPPTRRQTPLGPGRRTPRVRRASSARLTPIRAGAALVMLASIGAIYGVSSSSAFDYARVRLTEAPAWTDPAAVEAALAGARGQNLFRIATGSLETALEQLPTVERARIGVEFPDTLAVTLTERKPILIWKVGDLQFLVDGDGKLFAKVPDVPGAATAGLPVIDDRRSASAGLISGSTLDPIDLDAATRLASLVPADVGSEASAMSIVLTDENGFLLRSSPTGWTAVFGIYTPTIRTPELIPEQVRLLRSLLAGRESTIDRVILASGTQGTYVPKPTPTPSPSARPSPSAAG